MYGGGDVEDGAVDKGKGRERGEKCLQASECMEIVTPRIWGKKGGERRRGKTGGRDVEDGDNNEGGGEEGVVVVERCL